MFGVFVIQSQLLASSSITTDEYNKNNTTIQDTKTKKHFFTLEIQDSIYDATRIPSDPPLVKRVHTQKHEDNKLYLKEFTNYNKLSIPA